MTVGSVLLYLLGYTVVYSENVPLRLFVVILWTPIVLLAVFGLLGLIIFLITNSIIVIRREGFSFSHCIGLFMALGLISYLILVAFSPSVSSITAVWPDILRDLYNVLGVWIGALIVLYFIHMILFITGTFLANVSRPKRNQDFLIVHGAYIHDGKVTPLLAGRVDRAITFYNKQKAKNHPPKLIMSGGQGADESRAEAEAMADYARSKGIPSEDIIIEDQSRTTEENLKYSKRIMEEQSGGKKYRAVYVTSNYHVFRTGVYVRRAGMNLTGMGSKTALYYLPVATIREYIAYVMMYKKLHLIYAGLSLALSLGLLIFSYMHPETIVFH